MSSANEASAPALFLFHWSDAAGEARAQALRAAGWHVELETSNIERGVRRVLDLKPVAVVLDLARKSSWSRDAATSIRAFRAARRQMMVFTDGDKDTQKRIEECVKDAIFIHGEMLVTRLEGLKE